MLKVLPFLFVTLRIGGSVVSEAYFYTRRLILVEEAKGSYTADTLRQTKLSLFDLDAKTVTYFSPDLTSCYVKPSLPIRQKNSGWDVIGKDIQEIEVVEEKVLVQGVECIHVVEKGAWVMEGWLKGQRIENHHLLYGLELDENIAPFLGFFEHNIPLPHELRQYRYVLKTFLRHEEENGKLAESYVISTDMQIGAEPKYTLDFLNSIPRVSEADFFERY